MALPDGEDQDSVCADEHRHDRGALGSEHEIGPGDVAVIPAGHDAWTVGDEPCVAVDFTGVARYAKPS